MSLRVVSMLMMIGALLGCAVQPPRESSQDVYRQGVDQQMLPVQSATVGSAALRHYAPQPFERFRMPRPIHAPAPVLAEADARRELAPTRVCAQIAIAADGTVMFAQNLTAREECAAGGDVDHGALVEAMLTAVREWRFRPAALCRYRSDSEAADDDPNCALATAVEAVPVTLQYAFSFEIHRGQVRVHHSEAPR